MKRLIKDALVLFVITLVAGVALASVYEITKGPIAEAELAARAEAYRTVFPDAAGFEAEDALDAAVSDATAFLSDAGFGEVAISDALYAVDAGGGRIGGVMTVSGKGYAGAVIFTMGVKADGTLSGISILSHSETAGLGAKCTEEAFYGQFAGKPADTLTVVKTGAAEPSEIDAISGATVTSKGITTAVNAGIRFAAACMKWGGAVS